MRSDAECVWCHRTGQDVLERSPASGPIGARYECVNTRRCMKERTIRAIAARNERQAEREREREQLEREQASASSAAASEPGAWSQPDVTIYQGTLFGQGELFADGAGVQAPAPPAPWGYREPYCLHGAAGDTGRCEPCELARVWEATHAADRGELATVDNSAGANACLVASCLVHRRDVFWQSAGHVWVHSTGAHPCGASVAHLAMTAGAR
jgi:hypothetical protein